VPETLVHLGDLLREARAVLHEAGIADPARESRFLWESIGGGRADQYQDPASAVASPPAPAWTTTLASRLSNRELVR